MPATATNRRAQPGSVQRDAAGTGEFHLQQQQKQNTEEESSFQERRHKHSHAHIPPSRLRDSRLLAERVKRGAGRSIMELAWRVWAWVRPLYRNLEPRARKRRDEGGSTVGTLRDKKSGFYWTLSEYQSNIPVLTNQHFIMSSEGKYSAGCSYQLFRTMYTV